MECGFPPGRHAHADDARRFAGKMLCHFVRLQAAAAPVVAGGLFALLLELAQNRQALRGTKAVKRFSPLNEDSRVLLVDVQAF